MPALVCESLEKTFITREKESGTPEASRRSWLKWQRPKRQRVPAVKKISFSVKKGEIFGVLGPNGSGKSTLIRLIATLLLPDAGRITVFGYDTVKEPLAVRKLINRVSVDAAFFKKLSAIENLRYAARLYGFPARELRRRAREILELMGFPANKLDCPLENLSRGMQQKVTIARALLTSPVLLLLDEPTTGLDPKSKRDVQDFVLKVRQEHDATILLTTHDMQEAERLCNRIAFIHNGRFVAVGTPQELRLKFGNGRDSTMEDVFLSVTGKDWDALEEGVAV